MKKSHIYTRTGDTGSTSLIGGSRIKKHALQLDAYGTIDELNSHIGLLIATIKTHSDASTEPLRWIQSRLFDVGTHLAMPHQEMSIAPCTINEAHIAQLEIYIDAIDAELPMLHAFILPGGAYTASQCHVCRTVCRRAERLISALAEKMEINTIAIAFINRLSDFLFVYARYLNKKEGVDEIYWSSDSD